MAKSTTELEREIREALNGVPLTVRGLWHEMRELIRKHQDQEGGRPGHLQRNGKPISDRQLATMAGYPSKKVSRLLQELVEANLIVKSNGCWHAPRLARIFEGREKRRALTRLWRKESDQPERARSRRKVSRDTRCDGAVTTAQSSAVPPPASSPPHTPPLTPPSTSEDSDAAHPAAADAVARAGRPKRERKLSDQQNAVWAEFRDWWTFSVWPKHHQGEEYPFGNREREHGGDGPASIAICRKAGFDIEVMKRVALEFLAEPEIYGNYDHKLTKLKQKFDTIRRRIKAGGPLHGNGNYPRAAANGHRSNANAFTGARRDIPDVVA
jgi:hypothetical protein